MFIKVIKRAAILGETVTGTVLEVKPLEADGDYHIVFVPEPAFVHFLNARNVASERGGLVME